MASQKSLTKREADAFLRKIREDQGVDKLNDTMRESLRLTLDLLSDEISNKATHFLFELIQNADDNTYTRASPKLAITTVFPNGALNKLRVDCNEDGFNEENVKAICYPGLSTKKVEGQKRESTGEKGIGFKSVFKVADTVHISSGPWSFGFNRQHLLGAIVPIIEDFPSEVLPGQTQMLLDLRGEKQAKQINKVLEDIGPEVLIFLRRLKTITIKTPSWHATFRAIPQNNERLSQEIITISAERYQLGHAPDLSETQYMVFRYLLAGISPHPKRHGITESEIVLAFPLDENFDLERSQCTYAYLPIDDYGFKYLIQADFILNVSRETIDYKAEWNECLWEGIVEAFRIAVLRLISLEESSPYFAIRYTLPVFLGDRGGTFENFWSSLKKDIMKTLQSENILESRDTNAKLRRPGKLTYIPPKYRFKSKPLIDNPSRKHLYLSFDYNTGANDILPVLKDLGVKTMTSEDFFEELKLFFIDDRAKFLQARPNAWHEVIARTLLDFPKAKVRELPLIPLRDGRWVKSSEKNLFLNSDERKSSIPNGLDIHLVDSDASKNNDRKDFFKWLGIKSYSRDKVCDVIIKVHLQSVLRRSLQDCVSDVLYLFHTHRRRDEEDPYELWFHAEDGIFRGDDLYVDLPDSKFKMSKYAANESSGIRLLHSDYFERFGNQERKTEFVEWLLCNTEISNLPRLTDGYSTTNEFEFLAVHAVPDLLLLLRDNWKYYILEENRGSRSEQSSQETNSDEESIANLLRRRLSKVKVKCTDGRFRALDKTVLPCKSLKIVEGLLPFIDVPDPNNKQWRNFRVFGVLVEKDLKFYLRYLKALASLSSMSKIQESDLHDIYKNIQNYATCDKNLLQHEFKRNSLVFLSDTKQWVPLKKCVWRAPGCLRNINALEVLYPDLASLFHTQLKLRNATIDDVVNELIDRSTITSATDQKSLLLALSRFLVDGASKDSIKGLSGMRIFPIRTVKSTSRLMNYNLDVWYIPDREHLRDCFDGKVPLLDFTSREVQESMPLFKAINREDSLLSRAVKETAIPDGNSKRDPEREEQLRGRVKYLKSLIPGISVESSAEREHLISQLECLKVWRVEAIRILRRIKEIDGKEDKGYVKFKDRAKGVEIYILTHTAQEDTMVSHRISEFLIKFCNITGAQQSLVLPIVAYPHREIEKMLEEQNLAISAKTYKGFTFDEVDVSHSSDNLSYPILRNQRARTPDLHTRTSSFGYSGTSKLRAKSQDWNPSSHRSIRNRGSGNTSDSSSPYPLRNFKHRKQFKEGGVAHKTSLNSSSEQSENSDRSSARSDRARSSDSESEDGDQWSSENALDMEGLRSALPKISGTRNPPLRQPKRKMSYARGKPACMHCRIVNERDIVVRERRKLVGQMGEQLINRYLSSKLPDWAFENWTSITRSKWGFPRFLEKEKGYADFTYKGTEKCLSKIVKWDALKAAKWFSNSDRIITYHLEVKSTDGDCEEPFFMSNNQLEMARRHTLLNVKFPTDVYIVLRVYKLNLSAEMPRLFFKVYVDPWASYLEGSLNFTALDKYTVTPGKEGA